MSPTELCKRQKNLEKRYQDDMELEDAIHTALLTLREGFEGEMTARDIEDGIVSTKE